MKTVYPLAMVMVVVVGLNSTAATPTWAVEATSQPTNTALVKACETQEWQAAESLLASSPPNATQSDGMTALHWATLWKNAAIARQLIDRGADVDAATIYEVTPIRISCENGDPQITEMLLSGGADPTGSIAGGETLLMIAARTGNRRVIELLLDRGADPNATERGGQTALMWAAAEGHTRAVDALLTAGAKSSTALDSGFTAFFFAAREGKIGTVRRLLDAGADVNAVMRVKNANGRAPRNGMSALMLALESGHFELAIELLAAGANPNDQRSGFTPLHAISWTRKANRGDGVDSDPVPQQSGNLTSLDCVRKLVAAGARVNETLEGGKAGRGELHPKGATAFLLASKTADLPFMELLLDLGADPLLANSEGTTPLMAAAGVGVRAVDEEAGTEDEVLAAVQLLVARGADLNTVDAAGETAMHGAAYRSFPKVVDLLAAHGADPAVWNRKNRYGWTPFRIAEGYRHGSFKPSPDTIAALKRAAAR